MKQETPKEIELKNMVEALQTSLYAHKQHIANEVKEAVTNELSQLVTVSFKNLLENSQSQLSNFEYKIRLQFQSIDNRLDNIENKYSEITELIKNIQESFLKKNEKFEEEVKKLIEKAILSEQTIKSLAEMMKTIDENLKNHSSEISNIKEHFSVTKVSIVSEVVQHLNEHRRELEAIRYDVSTKLQTEVFGLCEKINEIRFSVDQQRQGRVSEPKVFEKQFREKDLFEYVQAGLSKNTMELSQMRLRIEKLEITEQAFEDFRKSRIGR